MSRNGEKIPPAIALRKFSGKFLVRVPPEIHKNLVIQSAESGISLNRLVNARLSQ